MKNTVPLSWPFTAVERTFYHRAVIVSFVSEKFQCASTVRSPWVRCRLWRCAVSFLFFFFFYSISMKAFILEICKVQYNWHLWMFNTTVTFCWQIWLDISQEIAVPHGKGCEQRACRCPSPVHQLWQILASQVRKYHFRFLSPYIHLISWEVKRHLKTLSGSASMLLSLSRDWHAQNLERRCTSVSVDW
jgi:hypothetical protein